MVDKIFLGLDHLIGILKTSTTAKRFFASFWLVALMCVSAVLDIYQNGDYVNPETIRIVVKGIILAQLSKGIKNYLDELNAPKS